MIFTTDLVGVNYDYRKGMSIYKSHCWLSDESYKQLSALYQSISSYFIELDERGFRLGKYQDDIGNIINRLIGDSYIYSLSYMFPMEEVVKTCYDAGLLYNTNTGMSDSEFIEEVIGHSENNMDDYVSQMYDDSVNNILGILDGIWTEFNMDGSDDFVEWWHESIELLTSISSEIIESMLDNPETKLYSISSGDTVIPVEYRISGIDLAEGVVYYEIFNENILEV